MVDDNEELDKFLDVLKIGAQCIIEIDNRFLLLVEIEAANMEFERLIVIKISPKLAEELLKNGVPRCEVRYRVPIPKPGEEVELLCAFVIDKHVFLVFEVENHKEKLIVVRTNLCLIC